MQSATGLVARMGEVMSDGEGTHYTVYICTGCCTYRLDVQASNSKAAFAEAVKRWLEEVPSDYYIGVLEADVHETSDDDERDTGGKKT